MTARGIGLAFLFALPVACNNDSPDEREDRHRETSQSGPLEKSVVETIDQYLVDGDNDSLRAMVDVARRAAAKESGVDQGDIETIAVTETVWPNSALGCPQQGRTYAQVLVPGARVQLRVGEVSYHYHCGKGYEPILCAKSARVKPEPHPLLPPEI